jgi:ABC-type bacteriocin/lantibiotic exporter with double-glycine peptidase domain
MTVSEGITRGLASSRKLLLSNVRELLSLAQPRQRRSLGLAVVCGILATLADLASLALIKPLVIAAGLTSATSTRTTLAAFILAALAASALRFAAVRLTVSTQYGLVNTLSVTAFERLQQQDYATFRKEGASRAFAAFDRLQMLAFQVISPAIAGIAAGFSAVLLLTGLLFIQPWVAVLFGFLTTVLALAPGLPWRAAAESGLSQLTNQRSRLLSEGRAGFRDVFLSNGQERLVSDFAAIDRQLRERQRAAAAAAQSSRHGLELVGFSAALIGLVTLPLVGAAGADLVPILGIAALAGLRLLPHLAAMRSAAQMISAHGEITQDVLDLLRPRASVQVQEVPRLVPGTISLERLTVRREGRPDPIHDLSLEIPQGARIGITGTSGTGKSTLLDVLAGASFADAGRVSIGGVPLNRANGRIWRERIGFVSQNPVLLGKDLREAVIFPNRPDEVDPERFDEAVRLAGVDTMAARFARGLDTPIGEALEHLSGGQRQRVALAHALYRARDLLLLDEATGQLDAASERTVVSAISALPRSLSIVLVSHRPAFFACCDKVFELRDGQLHETGLPQDGKSPASAMSPR